MLSSIGAVGAGISKYLKSCLCWPIISDVFGSTSLLHVYAFYCCLSLTFMYCCSLGFSRIIFNPTDKGTRHPSVYQKTLSVPVSFLYFSSKIMLGMIHWQTPITSLLCLLRLLNNFYSAFTKSRMRSDQVLFHIPPQLHFYEFLECFLCLCDLFCGFWVGLG